MTYLQYDGSFSGFLSSVFEVYVHQLKEVTILHEELPVPNLFSEIWRLERNEEYAERVRKKIISIGGKTCFTSLWKAFLSELPGMENKLLAVIRYMIEKNKSVLDDYSCADVLQIHKTLKKVNRERHRMTAFVRFKQATDGIYYSIVEPDYNVLPLISNHFQNRYADQRWLIFDQKRNYGIYYNLNSVEIVEPSAELQNDSTPVFSIRLTENENEFQRLWKSYFHSTGISSRKNNKLHLQHVPRRYWKYLTEKQPFL